MHACGICGCFRCHGIMNCSISCPKGLDPAGEFFSFTRCYTYIYLWARLFIGIGCTYTALQRHCAAILPAGAIRKMKKQIQEEFGPDFVTLAAQSARARSKELVKEMNDNAEQ